jgi:hypothetical protein
MKIQLLWAVRKTVVSYPNQTMRNLDVFFLPRYELLKIRNDNSTVLQKKYSLES